MGQCLSANVVQPTAKAGNRLASTTSPQKASTLRVKQLLQNAKEELEKGQGDKFAAEYYTNKVVGHGAFAKVVQAVHRKTGATCAVKIIQKKPEERAKQREGTIPRLAHSLRMPPSCTRPPAPSMSLLGTELLDTAQPREPLQATSLAVTLGIKK